MLKYRLSIENNGFQWREPGIPQQGSVFVKRQGPETGNCLYVESKK